MAESDLPAFLRPDTNPDRPKAMAWDVYEPTVSSDWQNALEREDEKALQTCIERHPCLLPVGAYGNHGAWMDAVITQPPLAGFHKRVPDFMWFESDSSTVVAVCVEIERQGKYWFNVGGTPTADLSQALDQIQEWRS